MRGAENPRNPAEELDLWTRALDGNEAARAELGERLEGFARRWFAHRVPRHEIDNLVQEAHLSLLRQVEKRAEVRSLGGFFHARCLAALTDWIRDKRRRTEVLDGEVPLDPVDERFRPAEALFMTELEDALAGCRDALKGELAAVWRLRYEDEKATREIAADLSLPYGTVLSRLFDARDAIWSCLGRKQVLA